MRIKYRGFLRSFQKNKLSSFQCLMIYQKLIKNYNNSIFGDKPKESKFLKELNIKYED